MVLLHLQGLYGILLFIMTFCVQASSTQKKCYRFNPRGGFDTFCCDNHVRINDACVECQPGTSSQNEKPCKPCSRGRYGKNCGQLCRCKINEKCESVDGCQLKDDLFTTNFKLYILMSTVESMHEVSHNSSNQHTSSITVHEYTSSKVTRTPSTSTLHVLQTIRMLEQSSITSKENENMKDGLSTRELLVYSLGSAAFGIICTFMCVAFICFHRGETRQLLDNATIHSENQVNEDNNSRYSLYESIDEGAIYDDNILDVNSENSEDKYYKTESEDSTVNSEKSGYLLPFTSIITNNGQDEHLYCTDVRYGIDSSVSSLSDHMDTDFKLMNSYEQLHTEQNKQSQSEYAHIHALQYLELIDVRKSYSNDSFTETVQTCYDSTVGTLINNLRKNRKCYSNNDISGQEIFSECITPKNKTEIRRRYSE